MPTVIINTVEYEVYADVDMADDYMNAAINAADWEVLSDTEKSRALVASTRLLDRQKWNGEKTDPDQGLAFPRTGLTYCSGEAVPSDAVPQEVVDASIVLANDLAAGSEAETASTTENKTKRLKAGSVELEYFKGDPLDAGRFTLAVMELIGCFLAGSGALAVTGVATGTDACEPNLDFGFNNGF